MDAAEYQLMDMKPFDRVLKRFLLQESRIIRKRSLPFGLSIMGMGPQRNQTKRERNNDEKITEHQCILSRLQ